MGRLRGMIRLRATGATGVGAGFFEVDPLLLLGLLSEGAGVAAGVSF